MDEIIKKQILLKIKKYGLDESSIDNEEELIEICKNIGVEYLFNNYIMPFINNKPNKWTNEDWKKIQLYKTTKTSMILNLWKLNDFLINECKDMLVYLEEKIWEQISIQIFDKYNIFPSQIIFNQKTDKIYPDIFLCNYTLNNGQTIDSLLDPKLLTNKTKLLTNKNKKNKMWYFFPSKNVSEFYETDIFIPSDSKIYYWKYKERDFETTFHSFTLGHKIEFLSLVREETLKNILNEIFGLSPKLKNNFNWKQKMYIIYCFLNLRNKVNHMFSIYKYKFFNLEFLHNEYKKWLEYKLSLKTTKLNKFKSDYYNANKIKVLKSEIEEKIVNTTQTAILFNKVFNACFNKNKKLNEYRLLDAFIIASMIMPQKYNSERIENIKNKIKECTDTFEEKDSINYLHGKIGY